MIDIDVALLPIFSFALIQGMIQPSQQKTY